jgi:hyaluronan synthase
VQPKIRVLLQVGIGLVVVAILWIKGFAMLELTESIVWITYSILVGFFILSRFLLASRYRTSPYVRVSNDDLPTVTIVVPAMNEEDAIETTLKHCLESDYPSDKLQVISIDDCSTDATLRVMRQVQATYPQLEIVPFSRNRGKRYGMATGVLRARGEILIFIDSDSVVEADSVRRLVRHFEDPKVAAVAGHADVYNAGTNIITRMQAVRYFIAFKVFKGAEAVFSSVTCCSGCFSAYRKSAVQEVLDVWLNQTFLGTRSTYGDDRSLTNYLLRDWRVLYAPDAQAYTIVPDSFRKFARQQMRWKKSWIRESLRASTFMWRKHPVMAVSFYLSVILPLLSPQVALRALILQPLLLRVPPYWYVGGVLLIAMMYGFYFRMHRRERLWLQGAVALLYSVLLLWQIPVAIATLRDTKWGTRAGPTVSRFRFRRYRPLHAKPRTAWMSR